MISFRQVSKYLLPVMLLVVLLVSVGAYETFSIGNKSTPNPNVYVGVAFGGNTTQEALALIEQVKEYTNLFILDAGRNPLTKNETAVNEICSYAVANGLSIIVNVGVEQPRDSSRYWFWNNPQNVTAQWKAWWGNKFLGMYYSDEPGGLQLDGFGLNWYQVYNPHELQWAIANYTSHHYPASMSPFFDRYVKSLQDLNQIYYKLVGYLNNKTSPPNYNSEASFFINDVVHDQGLDTLKSDNVTTFTSDYGLYWWDYKGGYDVMFAELGWNCSIVEQIDQVKGAARMQGKEWGSMITWTYRQAPYLGSYYEVYNDMLTSYEAGAKYIAVFDYPFNESGVGPVNDERHQFFTLQKFWNDIHQQNFPDYRQPGAALMLPADYGWGMRDPNDTIWGFWPTDDMTMQIAENTGTLLARYGIGLDIVFSDPQFPLGGVGYRNIYFWNQTVV